MIAKDGTEAAAAKAGAQATEVIDAFAAPYGAALLRGERLKLGLERATQATTFLTRRLPKIGWRFCTSMASISP